MKKLLNTCLAILILFLFVRVQMVQGSSFSGSFNAKLGGVAGGECTTPSTHTVDEGFLGAGYENAGDWTETSNGGTVDEDFSLTGTPPTDSCTEGLEVATAVGSNERAEYDYGSSINSGTPFTIYYEFQVTAKTHDPWASFSVAFGSESSGGSGNIHQLEIYNNNQQMELRGKGQTTATSVDIEEDTWLTVIVTHTAVAAESTYQCTSGCVDSTAYTFTRGTNNTRYFGIGTTTGLSGSEQITTEWGYFYVDLT